MRKKKQPDIKKIVRISVALIIVAAVVAVCAAAAPAVISKYRRSEADKAVAEGRFDRAVEMLLPELDRDPKNTSLRLEIVDIYIAAGNYSRAEYLLSHGMRELGGQVELYRRLCAVYVEQDKLYDAVELINNLSNPFVREAIYKERPTPPSFNPPPGDFREALTVSVSADSGACYVSVGGGIPSTSEPYAQPFVMPQGITELRAVTVSPDGIVSDWALGRFKLDDVLETVTFEDAEIERVARELLEMPTGVIVSDKLQTITKLELPEPAPYRTLNDLRFFTHLETLELTGDDTHVSVSALEGLSELKSLKLNNFSIDSFDLDPIGRMTWLTALDLSQNHIVSLESLKGLRSLESLSLSGNNILDLAPLAGLTSLKTLLLSQNAVEDTSPIVTLTGLNTLKLNENRIRVLRGLANMTSITELDVSNNSLVNIDYLKNLTLLETLNVSSNKELSSIEPLTGLTKLVSLSADGCCITSVEPLSAMSNLKTLSINENLLTSFVGLEGASSLSVLWANKNEINTLRALTGLAKLSELHIEYNKLPSLKAVKDNESLKQVFAFGNPLTETVTFKEGVTVYTGR